MESRCREKARSNVKTVNRDRISRRNSLRMPGSRGPIWISLSLTFVPSPIMRPSVIAFSPDYISSLKKAIPLSKSGTAIPQRQYQKQIHRTMPSGQEMTKRLLRARGSVDTQNDTTTLIDMDSSDSSVPVPAASICIPEGPKSMIEDSLSQSYTR